MSHESMYSTHEACWPSESCCSLCLFLLRSRVLGVRHVSRQLEHMLNSTLESKTPSFCRSSPSCSSLSGRWQLVATYFTVLVICNDAGLSYLGVRFESCQATTPHPCKSWGGSSADQILTSSVVTRDGCVRMCSWPRPRCCWKHVLIGGPPPPPPPPPPSLPCRRLAGYLETRPAGGRDVAFRAPRGGRRTRPPSKPLESRPEELVRRYRIGVSM